MKLCSKCGTEKPDDAFSKDRKQRSGLNCRCRDCLSTAAALRHAANRDAVNAKAREHRAKNAEKLREYHAKRRAENPAKAKAANDKYRANNAAKILDQGRARFAANKEKIYAREREWAAANKDTVKAINAMKYVKYRDKILARKAVWRSENKAVVAQLSNKRRARKLNATPVWANSKKIAEFYTSAEALNMLLGVWHHVDHIVPLQGKTVCGLHNEFNLQILTASENSRKGNRHWPDKP